EGRLAKEDPDQPQSFGDWQACKVGSFGHRVTGGDMRTMPAITKGPMMIGAADIVAHDVPAHTEIGAHMLAKGRHHAHLAVLPTVKSDAATGEALPHDHPLADVTRQRNRIPALMCARPHVCSHRPPPGLRRHILHGFHSSISLFGADRRSRPLLPLGSGFL